MSMSSSSRGRPVSRFWADDEEMAKKDDDLHLPGHSRHGHAGQWRASAPRPRFVARLGIYACVVILFFVAVYELAVTLGTSVSASLDAGGARTVSQPDHQQVPIPDKPADIANPYPYTYNGPVRFLELARSLHAITLTGGNSQKNKNVLFAAANLRSAATLLPMACQMAGEGDNHVHFALSGRTDISMDELLKVNGIDDSCKLFLHDARPDHAATSTDTRMTLVSARALYHINTYMHPQAVIIDGTDTEEETFQKGFQDQIRATRAALIELPERANARLGWLTKLDSSALAVWNKVHFDILIQAPAKGSGNLRRLLHSLAHADLSAVSVPHLTIELPTVIEPNLERIVGDFRWPPWSFDALGQSQTFSLRHRIPRQKMTEEESSVRFMESFWPRHPSHSHVLVLSPHTEISPQFFNYVKYSLLHHRYSLTALLEEWDRKLMGISFQHPNTLLDTATPFKAPAADKVGNKEPPFLWQAPSSDAVLYMGEKWVELHGYVSQLLDNQHASGEAPAMLAKKEVSKKHPSWLEHVLQLSRLRGYVMLYPNQGTAGAIIGVHTDLYDKPEEYVGQETENDGEPGEEDAATEVFDAGSQVDMMVTLPQGGVFLPLKGLPVMSWDGTPAEDSQIESAAKQYAKQFRLEVGGCTAEKLKEDPEADKYARDLFCNSKSNVAN